MKRALLASVPLVALACGVIHLAQPPEAPVNTCANSATCESEFGLSDGGTPTCTQSGGACSGGGFVPILVVTVPSETPTIGGSTFAIPASRSQEINKQTQPDNACNAAGPNCLFLPPLASGLNGYLNVTFGLGVAIWPPNGLRPNCACPSMSDNGTTSLPITMTFHAMWLDPASNTPVTAAKLGLPLPDTLGIGGSGASPPDFNLHLPTVLVNPPPGFALTCAMPQPYARGDQSGNLDPAQFYTVEVVPSDPFSVFPPFVGPRPSFSDDGGTTTFTFTPFSVAPAQATLSPIQPFDLQQYVPTFDPPTTQSIIQQHSYIVGDEGSPSLAGWTVYVVNADGHRVSGTVTLPGGADQPIMIYEATGTGQQGETLFIDPPPGVDLPRYTATALGSSSIIQGPFDYPTLPTPVTIEGFVRRADDLAATTASIVFYANGTLVGTDGTTTLTGPLLYSKTVTTIAAAQYTALLPPGSFHAYVIPDAIDLALTVYDNQEVALGAGVETGQTLFVNPRAHVQGRVVLGNGTPVFGAEVVIDASADDLTAGLATTSAPNNLDPFALPREARGTTDVNGFFDVLSDPGAVDISIRPHDGTNFPWVVLTNFTVPPANENDAGIPSASTLTLPSVVIPLPSLYGAAPQVLTDSNGNALPQAVVRAYAFPQLSLQPDGGAPLTRAARLIGVTTTDENGAFQLFVAPPDSQ